MKKVCLVLILFLVMGLSEVANANLTTIGTASYSGKNYNLIFEGTLGAQDLVWLDYTNNQDNWSNQVSWAAGLGSSLTVALNTGYKTSIDWTTGWSLPSTDENKSNLGGGFEWQGPDGTGYHNYRVGYNMVNSEMGHLFYESLGNKGYCAKDETHPQPGWGLTNKGDFLNLLAYNYWSSTEYSPNSSYAWGFDFNDGIQGPGGAGKTDSRYALAVHFGEVSAVPIPGALWLLGSGLVGLAGMRKRFVKV